MKAEDVMKDSENIINEIQSLIKALKDCGGWVKRGNAEGWFNHEILADALALLREKDAEIERLERICDSYALQYGSAVDKEVLLKQERADIVRKMQERIERHATNGYPRKVRLDVIDQIVKEMVEANE